MLEKLKKKLARKDRDTVSENKKSSQKKDPLKQPDKKEPLSATGDTGIGKKRKLFPLKKLIAPLIVIVLLGLGSYVSYRFYIKSDHSAPVYVQKDLIHVTLPEEIMEFCFHLIPDLYQSFMTFNDQMIQIDTEIERINEIAKAFPTQQKITDKEIKIWEKTRSALLKEFEKIQASLTEVYVLYRVNAEQGLVKIESTRNDLSSKAATALAPVLESTRNLVSNQKPPEGILQGLTQKIQKIFK